MDNNFEAQGLKNEENAEKSVVEQVSPVEQANANAEKTKPKFSGMAITGFVLSLVGILVLAIPCGIIGLVFSSVAMKDTLALVRRGRGMAIAGLVISIVDIVLGIVNIVLL